MDYNLMLNIQNHVNTIQLIIGEKIIPILRKRALYHDRSKYENPEKSTYDKYIPLLKNTKYGSDEYNKIKDKMYQEGLSHHYKENRHHPEYFENGVNDMNLIDVIEMVCDWYATSLSSDTDFENCLKINYERFGIDEQLAKIIFNTYKDLFKE